VSSNFDILSEGTPKNKSNKRISPWEAKVQANYGIKKISVDLSNSFTDDGSQVTYPHTQNVISKNPS